MKVKKPIFPSLVRERKLQAKVQQFESQVTHLTYELNARTPISAVYTPGDVARLEKEHEAQFKQRAREIISDTREITRKMEQLLTEYIQKMDILLFDK